MKRAALCGIALGCMVACGGDSARREEKPAGDREGAEARLVAAQERECGRLCQRWTECAVEDARAHLSAEEMKELAVEETAPRNTAKCSAECTSSPLSPRQVGVMKRCSDTSASDCAAYISCLDAAKKQPESQPR